MKKHTSLVAGLLLASSFFLTAQTSPSFQTVDISWLSGDQPKLLSAMAGNQSTREELNGTSLNVGTILGGWHAQAVGQFGDFIYIAFSDGQLIDPKAIQTKEDQSKGISKLWIYNTKTGEGQTKDLIEGYAHPCSIQVTGKYLAIVVEAAYGTNQEAGFVRQEHSMVLIYDLEKDPYCSVEASRLLQDGMNSGGAGLAYHPATKRWYMLVDQDNAEGKVVIYKSTGEGVDSWDKQPIAKYRRYGSGAGLNLITASDNSIWGLYFDTSEEDLPTFSKWLISGDQVKLFKLIEPDGTPVTQRVVYTQVVDIESPKLKGAGELLADRPGMRFGAGIRLENGQIELLTCQRNMNKIFNINRTVLTDNIRTHAMFVNLSNTRGEIQVTSSSSQTDKAQKMPTESWRGFFNSPVKADLNYLSMESVKKGFATVSVPKWNDAFSGESNAPIVLFSLEDNGSITGKMTEFMTKKATEKPFK